MDNSLYQRLTNNREFALVEIVAMAWKQCRVLARDLEI